MRFSRTNMRLAAARCRSLSRKIGVKTAEFSITAFCWRNADSRKSRTYERHNAEIRLELFNLSEGGREAEDAHEGAGRLLIAGGNGAPLFQPRPEPLHVVAIVVDPLRTGDLFLVALGRDGRAGTALPNVLAKGVAAQASVRHHPFRHPGQALQERDRMRQFMRLARSQDERHRASKPVGDHARLGPIAPTRAAQRFTLIARLAVGPLFSAPAALW